MCGRTIISPMMDPGPELTYSNFWGGQDSNVSRLQLIGRCNVNVHKWLCLLNSLASASDFARDIWHQMNCQCSSTVLLIDPGLSHVEAVTQRRLQTK